MECAFTQIVSSWPIDRGKNKERIFMREREVKTLPNLQPPSEKGQGGGTHPYSLMVKSQIHTEKIKAHDSIPPSPIAGTHRQ